MGPWYVCDRPRLFFNARVRDSILVRRCQCVVGYFVVSVCVVYARGGYFTVRYMDTCCMVWVCVLDAWPWLAVGVCFRGLVGVGWC